MIQAVILERPWRDPVATLAPFAEEPHALLFGGERAGLGNDELSICDGVITIPKATTLQHVDDNLAALNLQLTAEDLAALDRHFPKPTRAKPLDML